MKSIFIFLSKIYIFFFKDKNDIWSVFPIIIISTFITINIELVFISYINKLHITIIYLLSIILLTIIFSKYKYEYVKDFGLDKIDKIKIVLFFLVFLFDIIFMFKL